MTFANIDDETISTFPYLRDHFASYRQIHQSLLQFLSESHVLVVLFAASLMRKKF